jgi:hypothetical protein
VGQRYRAVLEVLEEGASVTGVARRYGLAWQVERKKQEKLKANVRRKRCDTDSTFSGAELSFLDALARAVTSALACGNVSGAGSPLAVRTAPLAQLVQAAGRREGL